MRATSEIRTFGFRFVTGGNAAFGKRHGAIGTALTLDDTEIPWEKIGDTTTRERRLIIALGDGVQVGPKMAKFLVDGHLVVIQPAGVDARQLEKAIDRQASAREAELRRAELEAKGMGHLVRAVTCPVCKATVDLSGLEKTRYAWCRFCESVFSEDGKNVTDGRRYRCCDECGMFDRIQPYPEFYFYFLVFVYGFKYTQRFLCDACAHRLFIKALSINFIFLLGIPTAIWVKVKSMQGREQSLATLADGNRLARRGLYNEARSIYEQLLRNQPDHPGILTNQALGHVTGGDQTGAGQVLARAVASCSSYGPAFALLQPQQADAVTDS